MQRTQHDIQQLFLRLKEGDKEAFNHLFRLKYSALVSFAESYLGNTGKSEELVSDLFVWLWQNYKQLNNIKSPETYLFVSVKNKCLNALRNTKKLVPLDEQSSKSQPWTSNTPHSLMENDELHLKLNQLINNLPPQQKQIFKMIKQGGLSARQVADILNISPRTVETHIYKAINKIEEEITCYLGYSPRRKKVKKMISLLF